jgi:hypothetical protein
VGPAGASTVDQPPANDTSVKIPRVRLQKCDRVPPLDRHRSCSIYGALVTQDGVCDRPGSMRKTAEKPSFRRDLRPRRRSAAAVVGALALVLGGILALPAAAQQAQSMEEPKLKALFLFNFVKFTTWPAEVLPAGAPLVLCTTDDEIASRLEEVVAGRTVESHALVVKRVKLNAPARGCAVLYAGRIDQRRAKDLFTALDRTSVLTVGDAEDFAIAGGMIGLFVDGGKMRFAVNIGAVERTQVRLSAQLLTLAKIIKS